MNAKKTRATEDSNDCCAREGVGEVIVGACARSSRVIREFFASLTFNPCPSSVRVRAFRGCTHLRPGTRLLTFLYRGLDHDCWHFLVAVTLVKCSSCPLHAAMLPTRKSRYSSVGEKKEVPLPRTDSAPFQPSVIWTTVGVAESCYWRSLLKFFSRKIRIVTDTLLYL